MVPAFCSAGNLAPCEVVLLAPGATNGTCSCDFEHVQLAVLPAPGVVAEGEADATIVDALYLDAEGNHLNDLHVVGVIYTDTDGPGKLIATSTVRVVLKDAPRSFVRLPFAHPVAITGAAVWIGEQAGAPGATTVPGGPNSLQCFGFAKSGQHAPLRYMLTPTCYGVVVRLVWAVDVG